MGKRSKNRRHCGNCGALGSRFTGPDGALFEHRVCNLNPDAGEYHDEARTLKCVCKWVENRSKPRGCFGWTRG
jgi:hypothetical protein